MMGNENCDMRSGRCEMNCNRNMYSRKQGFDDALQAMYSRKLDAFGTMQAMYSRKLDAFGTMQAEYSRKLDAFGTIKKILPRCCGSFYH